LKPFFMTSIGRDIYVSLFFLLFLVMCC